MKLQIKKLYPPILATCIFFASGSQDLAVPTVMISPYFDKLAHFSIFGLLASSVIRLPISKNKHQNFALSLLIVTLYGSIDEYRQSFTPGRSIEMADILANALGALCACSLYSYCAWYQKILEYRLFQLKK